MINFGSANIHIVFLRPFSFELRRVVTERSLEMKSLLVNIVAGPGKRMHVSDVLCELLQGNECSTDCDMNMKVLSCSQQKLNSGD